MLSKFRKYESKLITLLFEFIEQEYGIFYAAKKNYKKYIKFYISVGREHNTGLQGASQGGQIHFIDFFISRGSNNWNLALYFAADENHKNIVHFFGAKGATNYPKKWSIV